MMSCASLRSPVAIALLVCGFASSSVAASDPQFIGHAGCATATCHGGIRGSGPAWHSSASVFQTHDPHAAAGDLLLNNLSARIVRALEPAARDSDEPFMRTLETRCANCHAPLAFAELPRTSLDFGNGVAAGLDGRTLSSGVSCEACHGPASVWEKEHVRKSWDQLDRFSPATGMKDTESPLARTDNCARCHVGSRAADGQIRDMNHDMIAAGHPPLVFDMFEYQQRLPPHWATDRERLVSTPSQQLSGSVEALQRRVLLAAIRLSQERRADSDRTPQPELSEYDCSACHHSLAFDSPRQHQGSAGSALWQPWYTANLQSDPFLREQLRMGQPQFEPLLRMLEKSAREPAGTSSAAPALPAPVPSAHRSLGPASSQGEP